MPCGWRESGNPIRQIGRAIENEARNSGFSVVHELAGHGVGRTIHEDPVIPNFDDPVCMGRLTEGLVITIEPMIIAGSRRIRHGNDKWTVLTADGSLAAHFEETIMITADGPIIITTSQRQIAASRTRWTPVPSPARPLLSYPRRSLRGRHIRRHPNLPFDGHTHSGAMTELSFRTPSRELAEEQTSMGVRNPVFDVVPPFPGAVVVVAVVVAVTGYW